MSTQNPSRSIAELVESICTKLLDQLWQAKTMAQYMQIREHIIKGQREHFDALLEVKCLGLNRVTVESMLDDIEEVMNPVFFAMYLEASK